MWVTSLASKNEGYETGCYSNQPQKFYQNYCCHYSEKATWSPAMSLGGEVIAGALTSCGIKPYFNKKLFNGVQKSQSLHLTRMPRTLLSCLLFITVAVCAQDSTSNLNSWKRHSIPTHNDTLYAYNWSHLQWKVFKEPNGVFARQARAGTMNDLPFRIRTMDNREAQAMRGTCVFVEVDDGYLVAFNQGEFGGSLYWFDKQGDQRKQVSAGLISQFLKRGDKIFAIAGLDHMGLSMGGILEIIKKNNEWGLNNWLDLKNAPYAFTADNKSNLIVITSSHLLLIDENKTTDTLVADGFWKLLYPTSIVVLENKVFVGMRQGIFEFDRISRRKAWLMRD